MLAKLRNKRKEKKGFTLLELIIVIAIIAILLALLVPNLTKFLGSAKETSNDANAKTVYTGAAAWAADLAADDVTITAGEKEGVINIDNGTVALNKVVADKTGDGATDYAKDLKEYINGASIKNAKIVIKINTDYSIEGVSYVTGSGEGLYPSDFPTQEK